MAQDSRHVSEWIDRPADQVYEYAVDPAHWPQWAPGLGSSMEQVDGQWFVETPGGRAAIVFAPRNDYGVLDHRVTFASGDEVYNPMRVIAGDDGCEVDFTLRRLPGMSDEEFERDAGLVAADLARLKQVLEGR
jgi:Polyketide cyclase / dehydrase and lipid transport